jgi:hypothetical protein
VGRLPEPRQGSAHAPDYPQIAFTAPFARKAAPEYFDRIPHAIGSWYAGAALPGRKQAKSFEPRLADVLRGGGAAARFELELAQEIEDQRIAFARSRSMGRAVFSHGGMSANRLAGHRIALLAKPRIFHRWPRGPNLSLRDSSGCRSFGRRAVGMTLAPCRLKIYASARRSDIFAHERVDILNRSCFGIFSGRFCAAPDFAFSMIGAVARALARRRSHARTLAALMQERQRGASRLHRAAHINRHVRARVNAGTRRIGVKIATWNVNSVRQRTNI